MDENPGDPKHATRFQAGNPGRPKGSRNKLGEAFLSALHDDFEQHGVEVIRRVREERPQDYMKVCAALLPREVKITNETDGMTDEQIAGRIRQLAGELGLAIGEADRAAEPDAGPADSKGYH